MHWYLAGYKVNELVIATTPCSRLFVEFRLQSLVNATKSYQYKSKKGRNEFIRR